MKSKRSVALAIVMLLVATACRDGNMGASATGAATATPLPTPTATAVAAPAGEADAEPATPTPPADDEPTPDQTPAGVPAAGRDPVEDPAARASIATTRCPFDEPAGTEPECFTVTVPENWWSAEGQNVVELPVAVFPATGSRPASDPVLYLEGGPGGHALELLSLSFSSFFGELTDDRDVVLFDQRGVGYSDPALACPELDELFAEERSTVEPEAEAFAEQLTAVRACRDRLDDDGIDLAQYNSATSATDIEAMRQLLGYEEWNLLGISYGTRLAQTTMRLYPDGIRSVILDSVVPVADDRPAQFAPNAERAFEMLFDGCTADERCAAAYPDLEQRYFDLVDAWDANPVEFTGIDPLTGETLDFVFSGDDLLNLTFGTLYTQANFAAIPALVAQAEDDVYTIAGTIAGVDAAQAGFVSTGVFIAVGCSEEDPFSNEDLVDDLAPTNSYYQRFADDVNGAGFFEVCDVWATAAVDPVENERVESSIPTLLMAGAYDPITPPGALDDVQQGLSQSTAVVFPHEGHGVTPTPCGLMIARDFMDDPEATPDLSCVDTSPAPRWTVDPDQPITMVAFEIDELASSVTGLRPEEWTDQGNAVFARYNTVADPALLLVQNSFGMPEPGLFALLADALGWDDSPDLIETRTVNELSWNIYRGEFETSSILAAVSDAGPNSTILLLSGYPEDFPRFEDEIFEPALAATIPL